MNDLEALKAMIKTLKAAKVETRKHQNKIEDMGLSLDADEAQEHITAAIEFLQSLAFHAKTVAKASKK